MGLAGGVKLRGELTLKRTRGIHVRSAGTPKTNFNQKYPSSAVYMANGRYAKHNNLARSVERGASRSARAESSGLFDEARRGRQLPRDKRERRL